MKYIDSFNLLEFLIYLFIYLVCIDASQRSSGKVYVKPQRYIGRRRPAHVPAEILQKIFTRIIPAFA